MADTPSAALTAAFLAAVRETVILGDWLVQSTRLGLRLSFAYNPDGTWEHRLVDISDLEITVAPGGGLATVANASFTVAEDGTGQSMLQLWHRFATIGGRVDITIDFRFTSGLTFRSFTGVIDTITVQNGRSQVLCVDESIQRNLQLPQLLVTSAAYAFAASGAVTQPVPLVYGQGAHLTAAPVLLTNTQTLAYTAAAHPMTLASSLAVFNTEAARYMPGAPVATIPAAPGATLFLPTPLEQTLLNVQTGPLAIARAQNVSNPGYATDPFPFTLATVGTGTVGSNLDGQGYLGVRTLTTSAQRGNNQAVITLTNHRRALTSDPTVTGQFFVQTITPATGDVLRSALFTTQSFRHSLNPQTTVQTILNLTLGEQEAVEVLLVARNEGGAGTVSQYYEVGDIAIQTAYAPHGDTLPVFLYQTFSGRRDTTGTITDVVDTLLTLPSHVIASLLLDELGLSPSGTFQLAHTFYANLGMVFDGGLGYRWFVTRASVRDILHAAAQQAFGILSPDLLGMWNLRPYQTSTTHFAFTLSNILCALGATDATASDSLSLTLGNMAQVYCRFEIHYGWNAGAQKFDSLLIASDTGTNAVGSDALRQLCQLSALRYGVTEPFIIQAYWIADTATAAHLLTHVVRYFSFQRLTVTFDTTFQALSLQLGDFITVTHPLLPVGDNGGQFEVHTLRTSPTTGRVTVIASKVAAVYLQYFTLLDQAGTVWYFWFDTAGDLVRDAVAPAVEPFLLDDLTGALIPSWHQVTDPSGGAWFLWPESTGELVIDTAHPAVGTGLTTGLGQTAVALNTHTYRLGAGAAQDITIEQLD